MPHVKVIKRKEPFSIMNKITDNPRNVTKPLNICSGFHLGRHFFGLVGGFIVGLSVTLPHEVQIIKMLSKMKKTMKIWRIAFMMLAAFSLASCSSDDDDNFDASRLEGKWRKAIRSGVMDGETVIYTFYPENWYSGRIEEQVSSWPNEGWKTQDLNYRVGETGHMNIFTGRTYNGESKIYLEVDVRKLTDSEMVWYHTDSNEEIARFKREK